MAVLYVMWSFELILINLYYYFEMKKICIIISIDNKGVKHQTGQFNSNVVVSFSFRVSVVKCVLSLLISLMWLL